MGRRGVGDRLQAETHEVLRRPLRDSGLDVAFMPAFVDHDRFEQDSVGVVAVLPIRAFRGRLL